MTENTEPVEPEFHEFHVGFVSDPDSAQELYDALSKTLIEWGNTRKSGQSRGRFSSWVSSAAVYDSPEVEVLGKRFGDLVQPYDQTFAESEALRADEMTWDEFWASKIEAFKEHVAKVRARVAAEGQAASRD